MASEAAKSQPIWIKFCTHLLLYGIHFWADLDRDRRVGGSRPNQNDYVFVIFVTHPKSLYGDDGSQRFRRQTIKVEVRTGAIVKIPEFYSVGGARSKRQHFFASFQYPAHSLQETVLPQTNGTDGKPGL